MVVAQYVHLYHHMVLHTEKAPCIKIVIKSITIDITDTLFTDTLFIIKTKYRLTEQHISNTSHI